MRSLWIVLFMASSAMSSEPTRVSFERHEGRLEIKLGAKQIAEYVWNDELVRLGSFIGPRQ